MLRTTAARGFAPGAVATRALLGILPLALASCAPRPPAQHPIAEPVATPFPPPTRVVRLGDSIQLRPIELHVFGAAPSPALVIGGIHGSEPTSAFVAERLAEHLRASPALWTNSDAPAVAVLPVANPDGCRLGTRANARGVDVNRNFPASNWRRRAHRHNNYGAAPLSEPESRAIAEAVETLRLRLIVSIHSIDHGRHCNNFDGPARALAERMSRHNGYPVRPSMGYPTPGSLGSWAGIDQNIPIVTLELPRDLPGDAAWEQNRDALLAAVAFELPDDDAPDASETHAGGD